MVKLGLGTKLGIGTLAALGILAVIFRKDITNFFSSLSGGAAGIKSVTDLGERATEGLNLQLDNLDQFFKDSETNINQFNLEKDQFFKDSQTNLDNFFQGGQDFFSNIFKGISETVTDPFIPKEESTDITETPAAIGRASDRDRIIPRTIEDFRNQQNVQTDIEGNQFSGGGVSFIGGSVTETPIQFLSLGQIIDRFNVTASQAADIRARSDGSLEGFDFGTNTGRAIDLLTRAIGLPSTAGQTSNAEFEGLTPTQIALRLTGGNISNF